MNKPKLTEPTETADHFSGLLSCPFCGQKAFIGVKEDEESKYWINCMVCNAAGPSAASPSMANFEWNRRAETEIQAENSRLKEILALQHFSKSKRDSRTA